jgi:glycosyltransferase involved in cell wall biosynthesis
MKISILSAFYPFRGGIAHFNESLVRELDKDHQVQVNTFRTQYPRFLFPGKSQYVEKKNYAWEGRAHRIASPFNVFSFFNASRTIKGQEPEIFVANYWVTAFAPLIAFLGWRLRKRATRILLVHNLVPHEKRFFDTWMNGLVLNQFDGFVALSETVKNDITYVRKDAKVCVIQHPWYDQFKEPVSKAAACEKFGIDPSSKVLLFFGLVRNYKGLDVLLNAFSELDDSYHLVIAGEFYTDKQEFDVWFNDPALKERLHIHDRFIPDDEVHLFFSAADLCVLPYRSATQSGVSATSFQFGVPVVVTDVGGLSQTVREMGVVVPSERPDLLREALQDIFSEGKLLKMIQAIETERSNNSWKSFSSELVHFAETLRVS